MIATVLAFNLLRANSAIVSTFSPGPTTCVPVIPKVRVFALEDYPSPNNPLGAKGAGEGGIIPVGGVIANAVAAALRPLGVEPRELPLSPPRIWQLIKEQA